jgi:hypothetical protein
VSATEKKWRLLGAFSIGAAINFGSFALYLLVHDALLPTIKMYAMLYSQATHESWPLTFFKNFLWILPGIVFIFAGMRLFFRKRWNWLALSTAWISYSALLVWTQQILIQKFVCSYLVGSLYCGIMFYFFTVERDSLRKKFLLMLFVIFAFVFSLGSANIYLPLLFPAFLIIPLLTIYFIRLKEGRVAVFAMLPVLLVVLLIQVRSRAGDFLIHKVFRNDGIYTTYTEKKLGGIYDPRDKVLEVDGVGKRIRGYFPEKSFFLLYPRFPIYYWLVENAEPAVPKVDLENIRSSEWMQSTFEYMIKNERIPRYIFVEDIYEAAEEFRLFNDFRKERYVFIEKMGRFQVYRLASPKGGPGVR